MKAAQDEGVSGNPEVCSGFAIGSWCRCILHAVLTRWPPVSPLACIVGSWCTLHQSPAGSYVHPVQGGGSMVTVFHSCDTWHEWLLSAVTVAAHRMSCRLGRWRPMWRQCLASHAARPYYRCESAVVTSCRAVVYQFKSLAVRPVGIRLTFV